MFTFQVQYDRRDYRTSWRLISFFLSITYFLQIMTGEKLVSPTAAQALPTKSKPFHYLYLDIRIHTFLSMKRVSESDNSMLYFVASEFLFWFNSKLKFIEKHIRKRKGT